MLNWRLFVTSLPEFEFAKQCGTRARMRCIHQGWCSPTRDPGKHLHRCCLYQDLLFGPRVCCEYQSCLFLLEVIALRQSSLCARVLPANFSRTYRPADGFAQEWIRLASNTCLDVVLEQILLTVLDSWVSLTRGFDGCKFYRFIKIRTFVGISTRPMAFPSWTSPHALPDRDPINYSI